MRGLGVTFRRRQHEISKVDRTVFSDVGVASENGIYGHSRFCNTDFDDKLACLNL
ncbi:integrase, partial [Klebsiella pneumoniae]|nr:integrase [Klebsiella pneumoniae]